MTTAHEVLQVAEQQEPEEVFLITNIETLRVISDPLRIQILDAVANAPCTVKQIAGQLDQEPKKLYYHIKLLEEHGLLRVVEQRVVSGIIEKHYRIRARWIRVDDSLLSVGTAEGEQNLMRMLDTMIGSSVVDIRQSVKGGLIDLKRGADPDRLLLIMRGPVRLPRERVAEFQQRFRALMQDLQDAQDAAAATDPWFDALMVMYPKLMESEEQPADQDQYDLL